LWLAETGQKGADVYVFLIGGARSGKSSLATKLALRSGTGVNVVVTGEASDPEMAERIRRHRAERPVEWRVIEAPIDLTAALGRVGDGSFLVLDCLTLWVANLMATGREESEIVGTAEQVSAALARRAGDGAVVSNEVGSGVVPMGALARAYRDTLGRVNARFADGAARSVLVVAGRTLELAGDG
jgi:adenosylcobinamide kinase / adenosylcobinamide-phosphate guanylyltransferase